MFDRMSNYITDWIYANVPQAEKESREKIEYGTYMILSEITKISIILAIAAILRVFFYVIGIIVLFGLLRWCLGGIHAKTHWACLITSICFTYGILAVSLFLRIDRILLNVLIIPFSYLMLYKYAPADLPVKPIVSARQRKRLRITGLVLLSLLFILSQFAGDVWFSIIMLNIALASVLTTPLIYKLTKNSYGKEEAI